VNRREALKKIGIASGFAVLPSGIWVPKSFAGPLQRAHLAVIAGSTVVSGGSCESGTTDVSFEYTDGAQSFGSAAYGRSFTPSSSGQIYSIWVYISYAAASSEVELRWGTSSNLTTYEASHTMEVTSGSWNEFVFATNGNVSASTTYYFGMVENSGDARFAYEGTGGPGRLYASSPGWDMDSIQPVHNVAYKIDLCDS
jgi:hypothetical protein